MTTYTELKRALDARRCTRCFGRGSLDDAELGDIYYNKWRCPDCRGTGLSTAAETESSLGDGVPDDKRQHPPGPKQPPRLHGDGCTCGDSPRVNCPAIVRINEYLSLGGLFNPEAMSHDKVRDLLLDCREAIGASSEPCAAPVAWRHREPGYEVWNYCGADHADHVKSMGWEIEPLYTRPTQPPAHGESIAVWIDANDKFQWDFELNGDHPPGSAIVHAPRLAVIGNEPCAAPSTDLADYGYAPGNYTSHCLSCDQYIDFVDKRLPLLPIVRAAEDGKGFRRSNSNEERGSMSRVPIWCEIVCVECSTTAQGEFTSGKLERRKMIRAAREEGFIFKHDEALCSERCLKRYEERHALGE